MRHPSIMHTMSQDTWWAGSREGQSTPVPVGPWPTRAWNRFRAFVRNHIATKPWFDNIILGLILANCVTLAMDNPLDPPGTPKAEFLGITELVGARRCWVWPVWETWPRLPTTTMCGGGRGGPLPSATHAFVAPL
jgi:hypothetical protein